MGQASMHERSNEAYDVWVGGKLIGDVELRGSNWLAWDNENETYLWAPRGSDQVGFSSVEEAARELVKLHTARKQVAGLFDLFEEMGGEMSEDEELDAETLEDEEEA